MTHEHDLFLPAQNWSVLPCHRRILFYRFGSIKETSYLKYQEEMPRTGAGIKEPVLLSAVTVLL